MLHDHCAVADGTSKIINLYCTDNVFTYIAMADKSTTDDGVGTHPAAAPLLGGLDVARVLQSEGPVVKCVVLRAPKQTVVEDRKVAADATIVEDTKNPPDESASETQSSEAPAKKELLEDLVDEIEIDTTPQKNQVQEVLGGPFTFIGQYESEGIVLMALRGFVEEIDADDGDSKDDGSENGPEFASMSVKELRAQCEAWDVDTENMLEKQDLVDALKTKEQELPAVNPHSLQPPLHNMRVRGDILILKVAEVDEPLDSEESDADENDATPEHAAAADEDKVDENKKPAEGHQAEITEQNEAALPKAVIQPSNAEFFLPYTKAEYLSFAARTDIEATSPTPNAGANGHDGEEEEEEEDDDDDDENNNENEEDENDEEFRLAAAAMEEMTEEEEKSAMLNIVMSELLRKFREENERGANSREVLEIRASVAEQLGMEVATYDETEEEAQDGTEDRKRAAEPSDSEGPKRKRVKFDSSVKGENTVDEEAKAEAESVPSQSQPEATGVARLPPESQADNSDNQSSV